MLPRSRLLSSLVFFDLETTGLPSTNFNPKITEICFLSVSRFALENEQNPRVKNKLSLCFNPLCDFQPVASKISGLTKENLFHQKDFDANAVDLLSLFLSRLDPPVCLIAHNGYRFDFPLLKSELCRVKGESFKLTDCTGSPILRADSLDLFRSLDNKLRPCSSLDDSGIMTDGELDHTSSQLVHSTPKSSHAAYSRRSYKLADVYSTIFGSQHHCAHNAEGDCKALLDIVGYLSYPALQWLDNNGQDFDSIKMMYPFDANVLTKPLPLDIFPYLLDSKSKSKQEIELGRTFGRVNIGWIAHPITFNASLFLCLSFILHLFLCSLLSSDST